VNEMFPAELPPLPLLLWQAPPGLELALAQEGIAFARVRDPHPLAFRVGRFVLFDGRRVAAAKVRATLGPSHVAIDLDALRDGGPFDPFEALVDTSAAPARWRVAGLDLCERVARFPKAAIRRRVLDRLRDAVTRAGGLWARLAAFPFPYRSAFNLRVDLDEPSPDDYARFARARRPLEDCTTHFVSTHAYGRDEPILADLRRHDTQSHGHYHVVYRDADSNRRNVERAHLLLSAAGIEPFGFAAPEGRWNLGLDRVLEELGYEYASEFHLSYDDRPFFPWRDGRFSRVLQVPVHPLCEGLFLEAGAADGRAVAEHLVSVVRGRIAAGEPAFVYGHPERRLGRHPEVVAALAEAVAGEPLLWRATLTDFARWWRWRSRRRWAVVPRGAGRFEVQFDDWDPAYPLALEVVRGGHVASLPVTGPRLPLRLDGLAYERCRIRFDPPAATPLRRPHGLKSAVRAALDWETVTPIDDLPEHTIAARLKKGLRRWRSRPGQEGGGRRCA
jgi:peptidoglycan/xylan/chitin deacetylase (PgdA/CDA1 family)